MTVQLAVLPDAITQRVVVGTSLRKPLPVLQAWLASLDWQAWPERVEPEYVFVNDGLTAEAREYVETWLRERHGTLLRGVPGAVQDFVDTAVDSHQWSGTAMQRVGANKDKLITHAQKTGAAALWLCDADLIMDRTTLWSLWHTDLPITTAVYWTYWTKRGYETREIHAAPQVWLRHPYGLDGRGMDEAEFRTKLLNRELIRVPGYGACTLIRQMALKAGVAFAYLPDVPLVGLMAGEDRHFCLRTERMHLPAFADPWPDIFHIYHLPEDAVQIPAMTERLGTEHPTQAEMGNLVSLMIQPLEPVPHQTGWTMVGPQHIRGRLGTLALVPEIEEAIYGLTRGADVTVPVHFPAHYPIPYYRGKRRLIRVRLLDCKPYGYAPVVEAELFVGPRSGKWESTTNLTDRQLEGMREVVHG